MLIILVTGMSVVIYLMLGVIVMSDVYHYGHRYECRNMLHVGCDSDVRYLSLWSQVSVILSSMLAVIMMSDVHHFGDRCECWSLLHVGCDRDVR